MRIVKVIPLGSPAMATAKGPELIGYPDGGPRAPFDSPYSPEHEMQRRLANSQLGVGYVDTDAIRVVHPPAQDAVYTLYSMPFPGEERL